MPFAQEQPRLVTIFKCLVILLCASMLAVLVAIPAKAQTLNVLHVFTGGPDGAEPISGLTIDAAGNLYGTAESGGENRCVPYPYGCGTIYKVVRRGSGWLTTPIYSFAGAPDGAFPIGRVVFGPDGALYGNTSSGGTGSCTGGCGTVFKLQPQPTACGSVLCPWTETVLYRFTSPGDGFSPLGNLTFDAAGNIYGSTEGGGTGPCYLYQYLGCGTVFKLTHNADGTWSKSTLYSFQGSPSDGDGPDAGVVLDQAGNIYGTTAVGGTPGCEAGSGCGIVFELTPSGSGWTETVLHYFAGSDGDEPVSGVIFDNAGNLYGTTFYGGGGSGGGSGVVYKLAPGQDGWNLSLVSDDAGDFLIGPVTLDTAGNLYGTSVGAGTGNLYKLTPGNGQWTYTSLYSFNEFQGDSGGSPQGKVVIDAAGNLYSTCATGPYPSPDAGTVWEITP